MLCVSPSLLPSVALTPLKTLLSEEEFRQSAKEVAEALRLAKDYSSYYMPNFITAKEFHDGDKANINDMIFIRQSLGKMKNVVYALSCYSQLIHNAEDLNIFAF